MPNLQASPIDLLSDVSAESILPLVKQVFRFQLGKPLTPDGNYTSLSRYKPQVAERVREVGTPVVDDLIRQLRADSSSEALISLILSMIGPAARDAVPDLFRIAEKGTRRSRAMAMRGLASTADPSDAVPFMIDYLADKNRALHTVEAEPTSSVIDALGMIGVCARSASRELCYYIHRPSHHHRYHVDFTDAAILSLQMMGVDEKDDELVVGRLLHTLNSDFGRDSITSLIPEALYRIAGLRDEIVDGVSKRIEPFGCSIDRLVEQWSMLQSKDLWFGGVSEELVARSKMITAACSELMPELTTRVAERRANLIKMEKCSWLQKRKRIRESNEYIERHPLHVPETVVAAAHVLKKLSPSRYAEMA